MIYALAGIAALCLAVNQGLISAQLMLLLCLPSVISGLFVLAFIRLVERSARR